MNIRSSSVSKRSAQFSLRKQPIFLRGVFQNSGRDCGGNVAKHIREHIVQFKVRCSKAVLCPVFLTSCKVSEFPTIAHQISKLSNIRRGDKTLGDKTVLKDVGTPFGVPLVCFLAPNRFHILWVGEDNIAGWIQNVINGNPMLPGGFNIMFALANLILADRPCLAA